MNMINTQQASSQHETMLIAPIRKWVRGIRLSFHSTKTGIDVYANTLLVESIPKRVQSTIELEAFAHNYQYEVLKGYHMLNIPANRSNEMIVLTYPEENQEIKVRFGANFQNLTDVQQKDLHVFLTRTNETIGTLVATTTYTVIYQLNESESEVLRYQTNQDIHDLLEKEAGLKAYLAGEILIFDESMQVAPEKHQYSEALIAILDRYAGCELIPHALTAKQRQFYFSKAELNRQLGYWIDTTVVRPSLVTICKGKHDEVCVIPYYHTNIIPQTFFCRCGSNQTQTGLIKNRLCETCSQEYQLLCVKKSQSYLETRESKLQITNQPREKAFVGMHTNKTMKRPDGKSGEWYEIIKLHIINEQGDVLLDTLIRPMSELSQNTRHQGYEPEDFNHAPSFQTIYPILSDIFNEYTMVYFNAPLRISTFNSLCEFYQIENDVIHQYICLKEVIAPISRMVRKLYRLKTNERLMMTNKTRGVMLECEVLNIKTSLRGGIAEDTRMLKDIYKVLSKNN